MKELSDFSLHIENFLKKIQQNSYKIFEISENIQKDWAVFKDELSLIESKLHETDRIFDDVVFHINRIFDDTGFLLEKLEEFGGFLKEKYHQFLIIINSLKKIEELGNDLINIFEDVFFISRNVEIKAYHLGEEGKGLEVVAQELSKLTSRAKGKIDEFRVYLSHLKEYYENSEKISSEFIEEIDYIMSKRKFFNELFEDIKENKKIFEGYYESISDFISELKINLKNLYEFFLKFLNLNEETMNLGDSAFNLFSLVGGIHETIEFNEDILKNLKSQEKRNFPREKINLLLKDLENIIKGVEKGVNRIEENLKKWSELRADFEKYFTFKEGKLKEGVKKIESIFGENFRNNMNLVEKECYSILDSIKKIFKYLNEVQKIESKTGNELKFLKKSGFLFKNLIKDGEILSIYSMIEAKRALLEEEIITKGLKSLIYKGEENIKEIIEIIYSLEKSKLYKGLEIEFTDTLKKTESLKEGILHLGEKIEEIFKITNYLLTFEKKVYEWRENLQGVIEEFSRYEKDIKEEIKLTKEKNEEFFKATQKLRAFEIPRIQKNRKEILKLVLTSDPVTLNPYFSEDAISNTIISKIHNTLFVLSPVSTKILPLIIEGFEISTDGLKYKLKLKENVYFHNYKKLKSFEVYESFKKTLKGLYKEFFLMIQGAEDYIKGIKDEIEGIKIINENEIEIYLEYPFAPFISNLTLSSISITYDEKGKLYGCGPYILKEYIKGEKIILERFDKYFYGTPYFDIVEYLINPPERNVESVIEGKIHYLELSPLEIEELNNRFPQYKRHVQKLPALSIHRLDFNNEREPFNIKEIRKAICYAISSNEFVEEVLKGNGTPAKSIFPPGYEFYNPEIKGYEKNIQIAMELLKKAGFKDGFEFTLCYSDREVYRRAAEFIKKSLSELNINVITKEMGWKELLETSKGEGVDSIIIGWGADTPDPDSFIFPLFHSSQRTHTRFKNKEIDELIEKARKERNISKRKEIYKIIEEKVIEEAPCVFLYHPLITSLKNEKIFGISPHPIGSAEIIYAVKDD